MRFGPGPGRSRRPFSTHLRPPGLGIGLPPEISDVTRFGPQEDRATTSSGGGAGHDRTTLHHCRGTTVVAVADARHRTVSPPPAAPMAPRFDDGTALPRGSSTRSCCLSEPGECEKDTVHCSWELRHWCSRWSTCRGPGAAITGAETNPLNRESPSSPVQWLLTLFRRTASSSCPRAGWSTLHPTDSSWMLVRGLTGCSITLWANASTSGGCPRRKAPVIGLRTGALGSIRLAHPTRRGSAGARGGSARPVGNHHSGRSATHAAQPITEAASRGGPTEQCQQPLDRT